MKDKVANLSLPKVPRLEDYGLREGDLEKTTYRDMVLSDGVSSVIMVVGTALSIWAFSWWGIGIACIGLGILYLVRRVLNACLNSELDTAREKFKLALETYYSQRHLYDAELDKIDQQQKQKILKEE
jgi:hypothetical protein